MNLKNLSLFLEKERRLELNGWLSDPFSLVTFIDGLEFSLAGLMGYCEIGRIWYKGILPIFG